MATVSRLRFVDSVGAPITPTVTGAIYPRWVDVEVPEGPEEHRELEATPGRVHDPSDLRGSLPEDRRLHLARLIEQIDRGDLDALRLTRVGGPDEETYQYEWATYATARAR